MIFHIELLLKIHYPINIFHQLSTGKHKISEIIFILKIDIPSKTPRTLIDCKICTPSLFQGKGSSKQFIVSPLRSNVVDATYRR